MPTSHTSKSPDANVQLKMRNKPATRTLIDRAASCLVRPAQISYWRLLSAALRSVARPYSRSAPKSTPSTLPGSMGPRWAMSFEAHHVDQSAVG